MNLHDKYVLCEICGSKTYFIGKNTGFKCMNQKCESHKINSSRCRNDNRNTKEC